MLDELCHNVNSKTRGCGIYTCRLFPRIVQPWNLMRAHKYSRRETPVSGGENKPALSNCLEERPRSRRLLDRWRKSNMPENPSIAWSGSQLIARAWIPERLQRISQPMKCLSIPRQEPKVSNCISLFNTIPQFIRAISPILPQRLSLISFEHHRKGHNTPPCSSDDLKKLVAWPFLCICNGTRKMRVLDIRIVDIILSPESWAWRLRLDRYW